MEKHEGRESYKKRKKEGEYEGEGEFGWDGGEGPKLQGRM